MGKVENKHSFQGIETDIVMHDAVRLRKIGEKRGYVVVKRELKLAKKVAFC